MRATRLTIVLLALFGLAAGGALTGCGSSGEGNCFDCVDCPDVEPFSHEKHFTDHPYEGKNLNTICMACHSDEAADILKTGHWNWEGVATNLEGLETEVHGKTDLLNNFCIAIPSNEGRCTQCHIGVGWADNTFDHTDPNNVDCLICHDTTGLYSKEPKTAGAPPPDLDWNEIGKNVGTPGRANCGKCHYGAGGGDNVKHGDLAVNLNDTTREYDVHMATDGGNFACQTCHQADADHGIGGMPLHSSTEGNMMSCGDCHTGAMAPAHPAGIVSIINMHPTLSCQVCHIPAIARFRTTKVEWYWSEAGDGARVPVDVGDGRFDYSKLKGEFVWAKNVRPTLRRHNGKWNRMVLNVNDTYTTTPVVLGEPAVSKDKAAAAGAMIYPFKKMIADQVADVVNKRIMVPHLFGKLGGPNPYWGGFDWDLALIDGAAYTGQPYASGDLGFVETVAYLTVNHEVAPKEQALGNGSCGDCHSSGQFDWTELGYASDPKP